MSDLYNIATYPLRALWFGLTSITSSFWTIAQKIHSLALSLLFPKPADSTGFKEVGEPHASLKGRVTMNSGDDEVFHPPSGEASSEEAEVFSDAPQAPTPWSFNEFDSSDDNRGDFLSALAKIVSPEKAEALFEKVKEVTKSGGPFEQQALRYSQLLGKTTIQWEEGVENFYTITFVGNYTVISRPFSIPSAPHPITGKWMIPLNEAIAPTPSFSVSHIHDWRLRKFLVTFHQMWNATAKQEDLEDYKKRLMKGSPDPVESLGGRLHEIVRLLQAGLHAEDEQSIFAIWKSLEVNLRMGALLAKQDDPSTLPFRLFNAFIDALFHNPQLEFFQCLHASLLENRNIQPSAGIQGLLKAHEENKGRLETKAKAVNDKKSVDDLVGYCNLLGIGRFPYPLITFSLLGKKVSLYSLGTPTIEQRPILERAIAGFHLYKRPSLEVDCTVHPLFQHWVDLKKREGIPYVYHNLQPLVPDTSTMVKRIEKFAADNFGTKSEPRRAAVLKEWLGRSFASYPADGPWYQGGKEGVQKAKTVKEEALEKLTHLGENAIVAFPAEWMANYKKAVDDILELVHEVFFPSLKQFSKKDRQLFNELTKAFLVLEWMVHFEMELADDSSERIMSIVCRDGMDRAGMLIALVTLLIKIMEGEVSPKESQKTVQTLYEIVERLCSTTFLTAEQAIEDGSGRRTRLLGCWEKFGLSLDSWSIEDPAVIKRLVSNDTFKALKQRLKMEERL